MQAAATLFGYGLIIYSILVYAYVIVPAWKKDSEFKRSVRRQVYSAMFPKRVKVKR